MNQGAFWKRVAILQFIVGSLLGWILLQDAAQDRAALESFQLRAWEWRERYESCARGFDLTDPRIQTLLERQRAIEQRCLQAHALCRETMPVPPYEEK
jgi:hypothetical protein